MKILVTLLLSFTTTSCVLMRDTVEIGMSESEFKKKNIVVFLSEMTAEHSVYRLPQDEFSDLYVYFEGGKLVRVQEVVNKPTILIEKRVEQQ